MFIICFYDKETSEKNTPERFYFDYTNYKECFKNSEKLYEVGNKKNNKYREDNIDYKFLYDSKITVNYCYPIFLSFYNFNCTYYYKFTENCLY